METVRRTESACRCLFGPGDHDQLRSELTLQLTALTEQDSRRWNFSFHSDTPLPGPFQWEEIPAGCVPSFYHEFGPVKDDDEESVEPSDSEESSRTDQENRSSVSNTCKRPAAVTPVRRKRALVKATAKPRVSARITDFFRKEEEDGQQGRPETSTDKSR